ncbi:Isochorismatase hydrolase, partial [Rhizoclosmatium globosum]
TKFSSHIHEYDAVIGIASKVEHLHSIHSEQIPAKLGPTDPRLLPLLPQGLTHTFSKSLFSMLTPEVTTKVTELGINHVILLGIESHVCVLQTALDLLEKGIGVTVLKDAVSSVNRGEIEVALEQMRNAGAAVSTSESVLFQLMGSAEHPGFRAIQALLKETKEETQKALNVFCT